MRSTRRVFQFFGLVIRDCRGVDSMDQDLSNARRPKAMSVPRKLWLRNAGLRKSNAQSNRRLSLSTSLEKGVGARTFRLQHFRNQFAPSDVKSRECRERCRPAPCMIVRLIVPLGPLSRARFVDPHADGERHSFAWSFGIPLSRPVILVVRYPFGTCWIGDERWTCCSAHRAGSLPR
jgi:hypothetical protein